MGLPRLETKRSRVFGKIPDWDWDHGVWSGPDRVPIGPGPNFPNTSLEVCYLLLEGSNSGVEGVGDQYLEVCDCFIQQAVQVVSYNGIEGGRGFQVWLGVIIVAGVTRRKGDRRLELLETFVLL